MANLSTSRHARNVLVLCFFSGAASTATTGWAQEIPAPTGAAAESPAPGAPAEATPEATAPGVVAQTPTEGGSQQPPPPRDPAPAPEAPEAETPPTDTPGAPEGDGETTTPDAAGEGVAEPVTEEEETGPDLHSYGHLYQGGIGIMVGTGLFWEISYGGRKCGQVDMETDTVTASQNCSGMSPLFIDFQGSFGVTQGLEVLLEFRLGLLEQYLEPVSGGLSDDDAIVDAVRSRPMAMGLGVRYYTPALDLFKFMVGVLVDVDFTDGLETDFTLRPLFGIQVDVIRYVGIFLQISPTISIVRSLRFAFDGGLGMQFRFP